MKASSLTHWVFALGALLATSMVFNAWLVVRHGLDGIRLAWADDQEQVFDEMVEKSRSSDIHVASECLEYVATYYSSGTKHEQGSPLDRIVERHRQLAIASILEDLRERTGEDFGDDPLAWIEALRNQPNTN